MCEHVFTTTKTLWFLNSVVLMATPSPPPPPLPPLALQSPLLRNERSAENAS